jgi:hypothetical protein
LYFQGSDRHGICEEDSLVPIPDLDGRGLLPPGVHPCRINEVRDRFGQFQSSDRRCRLFDALEAYVHEAGSTGLVAWLVVNGSFVTGKADPNDIDIVIVVRADHDFGADLRPFEYNVVSRRRVRKRYPFDVLVAREGSRELDEYVAFFQQVRGEPDLRKGVLKVEP